MHACAFKGHENKSQEGEVAKKAQEKAEAEKEQLARNEAEATVRKDREEAAKVAAIAKATKDAEERAQQQVEIAKKIDHYHHHHQNHYYVLKVQNCTQRNLGSISPTCSPAALTHENPQRAKRQTSHR
jgi:K+/H+ antiporter YhaU regulatory subunit KhtT